MLRRLVAILLTGVLAIFSIGCAKEAKDTGPPFPKIPKGFESKPGFGAMNEKKPATEPGKEDVPKTEGTAPAGETTPTVEPPAPSAAPAGDTAPTAEPAKTDAPPTEGAAPAGAGGDAGSGTEKTN